LLRKEWAAAVAFVLLFTVFFSGGSQFTLADLAGGLIYWILMVLLLIRFGLLAIMAQGFSRVYWRTFR
jgi:hypothetical protein